MVSDDAPWRVLAYAWLLHVPYVPANVPVRLGGSMSDCGGGKFVIGRKRYRCASCQGPIPKGEEHYHQTGQYEGEWQNWRAHQECHEAWAEDGYEELSTDGEIPERIKALMATERQAKADVSEVAVRQKLDTGGLRRDMCRAMAGILGAGYVPSYYESAASEFIQIAESYGNACAKNSNAERVKAERIVAKIRENAAAAGLTPAEYARAYSALTPEQIKAFRTKGNTKKLSESLENLLCSSDTLSANIDREDQKPRTKRKVGKA